MVSSTVQVLEAIGDGEIGRLSAPEQFVWLDLLEPPAEQVSRIGREVGWHPLVIEDMTQWGQRAKLERYGDDYLFISFYGARRQGTDGVALVEVHLAVSGTYVVTVRRERCPELEDLRRRLQQHGDVPEQFAVYSILDALTDSFFPVLERLDDRLDGLEDDIVRAPGDQELAEVFQTKRLIVDMRRVITPQRDMAARTLTDLADLPGLDAGTRDYFRDLYDHLIRIADQLDSYRDLLTSIMDVYMSTVSNRLNVVMKQLTIISTIFLPLSFVTGFFGQNFGWLTEHITSFGAFLVLGIGGLVVPGIGLFVLFRRQGYLRDG
jgi:magnesium transporter